MRTRLITLWDRVRNSYWFLPGLMSAAAALLSVVTGYLDRQVQKEWARTVGWIWAGGADGAREVLSTIASSMIGVAGVTFSITIVALQLASSQFGPRVLRNFMSDVGNQIVLGTFIATFLYCLLVLRTVRGLDQVHFIPYVSVTVGLVLAVTSLGVLIYFVHHVSESIQAENLIAAIAKDFETSLRGQFPDRGGPSSDRGTGRPDCAPERDTDDDLNAFTVKAENSGYLQIVELDTLIDAACEHDVVLHLSRRPGAFVTRNDVLAKATPAQRCDDRLISRVRDAFVLGRQRTPRQDIEYPVNQLAQIAVRALSPGINDPYTALICIDWLGASLCSFAQAPKPSGCRRDEQGRLRIVTSTTSFKDLVGSAFDPIRRYGRGSPAVITRLLDAIASIAGHVEEDDRDTLAQHARLIERAALDAMPDEHDRIAIRAGCLRALDALTAADRSEQPPSRDLD